jgi:hypothetical protein
LYGWEADDIAARRELAAFMDAVIIVDLTDYQRSPGELSAARRSRPGSGSVSRVS